MLLQNAPYKFEDFSMINLPSRDYTLAATSSDSALKSYKEVVDKLKADPSSVSIGVQPASADYANMVLAMQAAGIDVSKLRIVTYDGGGPARNATAGAQVDVGFVGAEGFLPLKSKIRPLAMFAAEKVEWYPEAPLIAAERPQDRFRRRLPARLGGYQQAEERAARDLQVPGRRDRARQQEPQGDRGAEAAGSCDHLVWPGGFRQGLSRQRRQDGPLRRSAEIGASGAGRLRACPRLFYP